MGPKEWILKRLMKEKIIDIFKKEVEMHAKYLDISQERIFDYIYMYLDGRTLPVLGDERMKVIEIFNDRVKFYCGISSLSEHTIKEVVKEYLSQRVPRISGAP